MFFRLRDKFSRQLFSFACREIDRTPPLVLRPFDLTILTMLSHHDLMLYLVAIKSLYRRIGEGWIVVLDDGSLTYEDKVLLKRHIPDVRILAFCSVENGACPKGGCWERLISVIGLTQSHYVIQMDSDTLTLEDIPEVLTCYAENRSFLLGSSDGQRFVSVEENCVAIRNSASDHLQGHAERALPRLSNAHGRKYVRGGAAFAGFAKGSFSIHDLQLFSAEMQQLIGPRWHHWGSEQVASNFMIANSPDAFVLPYPKYASFWPNVQYDEPRFLHFLGTNRFKGGVYRRLAQQTVGELRQDR
jgi:hypothetical protein